MGMMKPAMNGPYRLYMHECGYSEAFDEAEVPDHGGCDRCESGSNDPHQWRPLFVEVQVKAGPECTCARASDTGHESSDSRRALAVLLSASDSRRALIALLSAWERQIHTDGAPSYVPIAEAADVFMEALANYMTARNYRKEQELGRFVNQIQAYGE